MNLSRMAIVPQFFHKRVVKSRPCCLHLAFIRICSVLYRDESDRKFDTPQTISAMSPYHFCWLINHYQITIAIIVSAKKKRVLWQIFHHFYVNWLRDISLSTWNVNRYSDISIHQSSNNLTKLQSLANHVQHLQIGY